MWGPRCCDRVPLSTGVFTECYRKDEERAQKLLTRVSEAWGKTTCLQLALEAKDMKFVSHGGIQVTVGGPASRNSRPAAGVERQPPLSRGRTCSPGSGPLGPGMVSDPEALLPPVYGEGNCC